MITYLAGPIDGCTDSEATGWREHVKDVLGADRCLDPMTRDYRGQEDTEFKAIVELDKADIRNAEIMLANCWKAGWGTPMEIHLAWALAIPVIAVVPQDARVSPWLRYHSDAVVRTMAEALDLIEELERL